MTVYTDKDLSKVYCYDTPAILKALQSGAQFALIDYDDSVLAVCGRSAEAHLPAADPVPELEAHDATDQPTI